MIVWKGISQLPPHLLDAPAAALKTADAAVKTDKCDVAANKAKPDCVAALKAAAAAKVADTKATASVKAAEAAEKKAEGGSPVGIIIGVVAAVVIIGGGAAWYMHDKKKKADAEKNGGDVAFSADDNYSAFVDVERQWVYWLQFYW